MRDLVKYSFEQAASLVGILIQYQDPESGASYADIPAIPQETDWEALGVFAPADSGRVRSWLILRESLPVLPEPGHLVIEQKLITSPGSGLQWDFRAGTYVLAPLVGSRVYDEIPPEGILMRITGKLHDDSPIG